MTTNGEVKVLATRIINDPMRGKPLSHGYVVKMEDNSEVLYSYGTPIALRTAEGDVRLNAAFWNYSKQTAKHRDAFLNETQTDTVEKLKSGVYQAVPFATL